MTNPETLPVTIGESVIDVPMQAWDEILRLRVMLDEAGVDWRHSRSPARRDAAGNMVLEATFLERAMADALNQVKAWADMTPPISFPWGIREVVEATLLTYEIRRRP